MNTIRIQHEDFDIAAEIAKLDAENTGAVATFTGMVRKEDGVTALTLEHYPQIRGRTVFLQIAPPSRSDIPEYQEIRRELEAAAGRCRQ